MHNVKKLHSWQKNYMVAVHDCRDKLCYETSTPTYQELSNSIFQLLVCQGYPHKPYTDLVSPILT